MINKVERLAIAALLHDIGKFWSRTGQPAPFTHQEQDHFGTYAHALWSAHFVEQYLQDTELASWVRMHHKPDSRESRLIALADWLSSGERAIDVDQTRDRPEAACLVNILGGLRTPDPVRARTYFPLTKHGDFGPDFMPNPVERLSNDDYQKLWDEFTATLEGLEPHALGLKTWLSLLRRFCSRIPSATPTKVGAYVPDINLYDHSRSVAALAACFEADGMTEERAAALQEVITRGNDPLGDEPVCQLVCGTLCGIQDFLYTIVSKQAAKTLRGRSLVLQIVSEVCAEQVCERAGAPACCIIYSGGGRFYALLPLRAAIEPIQADLSGHVYDHFQGQLSLVAGAVSLSSYDFTKPAAAGAFAGKWRDAGIEANSRKAQRLSRAAAENYERVFGFLDEGGTEPKCAVCGRNRAVTIIEEDAICADCEHYADLGKQIRDARWLVRTELSKEPLGFNRFCARYGFELRFIPDNGAGNIPRIREIVELNNYDPARARDTLRPPVDTAYGYRFLAQAWPRNKNRDVKTFEELANSSRGAKKLGVYRADVDNLGALFSRGLGDRASISRVASLSAALSDFFEGYLNHYAAHQFPVTVGVIYSGGDDLFVVGAWSDTLQFAMGLREKLDAFSGGHPALTLSGGAAIVEHRLPLRFAADLAREAEEASKSYERNGRAKNALTVFNTPIGFEELPRFVAFQKLLERMLTDGEDAVPIGFLRRLYDIWDAYLRERKLIEKNRRGASLDAIRAEARWRRWRWHLAYNLARFAKRHERWQKEIEEVRERLLDVNEPIDDRLGVPLRWTELLLREEE